MISYQHMVQHRFLHDVMASGEMTSEYKDKHCGGAGQPLTKSENNDGKKVLTNGMSRVHRVLTDDELASGRSTRWTELEIHGRVKNLSPSLWQLTHLSALFLNNNQLQRLPPEIAQLTNLTMLDVSNNKIRSLPTELGDMISLCHLYLNNNQLRVLPYELGKLFRIQTLGLQGNPLSPEIAKIYHETNGAQKILQFLLDHLTINTHPPPERNWVMIRHADPERPIATFTVLCYNVLCDKYATVNQYSYCPSWALNWEYRKSLIIKEIRTYEADVITLQEVETEQFRTLFQPELKQLGYIGIFAAKSRAKTMGEEERKYVDGCAIFWKVDKFDVDKHQVFEFSAVAMKKASTSENILNRVMPRDNIALCAVLKIKENVYANRRMTIPANDNVVGNPLVVCTAHIHWDPEFCDVKLVQSMMLAHEVSRVLDEVSKKYQITQQQVPVLICGDLNSLPDSGVFEYFSKGQITRRHMDLKSFREDSCLEKFTASTDKNVISHPLRLDSACDIGSIPFTNYTLDFKGMIDYIFATPQSLARLGILGPFDTQWVQSNKILGFPHPHVPSDHIPIMAQYAIIPTTHQRQPPPPQPTGHPPAGVIGSGYPTPPQHSFLR
uniref:poly(A)-specific ribonuclease n=1 Tax=Caenorhabditis tropicalis TaxID=1561998 RepID=A0A1I7TX84_9PELO